MKKTLSLALVLLFALLVFAGCTGDYIGETAKNADNYTLALSYDAESHVLSAVQTVEITNRSENTFGAVKFHIYANQYREDAANAVVPNTYRLSAYKNGYSYGDISFDSVKVDGNAVAYVIEGQDMDILSVPLAEEFYPGDKVSVEMVYEITLANIWHRLGYGNNTVNLGNFYPVLCHIDNGAYNCTPYYAVGDPFVTDVANYTVTLTVPSDYVVAATGELTEAASGENGSKYVYRAEAVRDFAMVLSNKFKKVSRQVGDTTVNYYYFSDTDCDKSLETAVGMLEYMNAKVGKYPYKQLSVAETDFCYGGMEYPNMVMVTSGSQQYTEAIVHEIAHQWFYGIVGNDQIADAWMDEGLADFLTMLYIDASGNGKLSDYVKAALKNYTTYVDVLNRYFHDVDVSFRPLSGYKNDQEYLYMTYVKGSLLFYTLYDTMGESKFFKALSRYFDDAKMTLASPAAMITAFSKAHGSDLTSFFNTFIEGKDIIGKVEGK